jgi:hypothetical protein
MTTKNKSRKRTAAIGDSPVDEGIHKPSQNEKTRTISDTGLSGHLSKSCIIDTNNDCWRSSRIKKELRDGPRNIGSSSHARKGSRSGVVGIKRGSYASHVSESGSACVWQ